MNIETIGHISYFFDTSFIASLLIIVVLIVRALLKGQIPRRVFLLLWGIISARLLSPWSLQVPYSFFSLLRRTRVTYINIAADEINKRLLEPLTSLRFFSMTDSAFSTGGMNEFSPVQLIWHLGIICCVLLFAASYLLAHKRYAHATTFDDPEAKSMIAEQGFRRRIRIKVTSHIHAPLTYGLFFPVILLPQHIAERKDDSAKHMLYHELVHIRRPDALLKLIFIWVTCLHWFNPFVWMLFVLANRDIETLCDEKVIRHFGPNITKTYAELIVSMEEKHSQMIPLSNGYSKTALEERLSALLLRPNLSVLGGIATSLLVALCILSFTVTAPRKSRVITEILAEGVSVLDSDVLTSAKSVYRVGKDIDSGFYIMNGHRNGSLIIAEADGYTRTYDFTEVCKTIPDGIYIVYLPSDAHVRLKGEGTLQQITKGAVISDKTSTVYMGDGIFKVVASIPEGAYSVRLSPGEKSGYVKISNANDMDDVMSHTNLVQGERVTIHLQKDQMLEIVNCVLECNG